MSKNSLFMLREVVNVIKLYIYEIPLYIFLFINIYIYIANIPMFIYMHAYLPASGVGNSSKFPKPPGGGRSWITTSAEWPLGTSIFFLTQGTILKIQFEQINRYSHVGSTVIIYIYPFPRGRREMIFG